MQRNYTEKELRTTIIKEKVEEKIFYYSVAKKEQNSLSFLSNERLLVLDFDQGKLFYMNQIRKLPFYIVVPKPKNQFTFLLTTSVIHDARSPTIEFVFHFNNEQKHWKFTFETSELAEEWLKLFEFHRQSQKSQEKQMKILNKSIVQMPNAEKETANNIVKEPERDIAKDESRLLNQMIGLGLEQSRAKTVRNEPPPTPISPINAMGTSTINKNTKYRDWNLRFYQNRDIQTLYEFKKVAIDAFFSSFKQDHSKKNSLRIYDSDECTVKIANKFTVEAKRLKNEYRNFHFILEATNKRHLIGVPLVCLIEFETVVGQVKARFPERAETIPFDAILKENFNELQRYTRIKNKALENATLLNLSSFYDSRVPILIYIQELNSYLPLNTEFPKEETLVRPEYILDHVDYFIYGGVPQKNGQTQTRQLRELSYKILEKVRKFSNTFYSQSFPVCTIGDLKTIIHEGGFNLKFLPHIYHTCTNNKIKEYIYTAMTAKVVKDYIFQTMSKIRQNDDRIPMEGIIEESISILLSGNNNKSHELWKQIALLFKKKYNLVLNHKDILPGFFFNSVLELIPGSVQVSKINKRKLIFQETNVIENGFFAQLQPKVKCLDRFLPEYLESIKLKSKTSKKSEELCENIRKLLFNDAEKRYEVFYQFGNNDEWMVEYLSYYYPPENLASSNEDRINLLFDRINEEPPSYFSLTLTKNYLQWCNKKENTTQFKKVFEKAMGIADYWLDEIHPVRSDLLEILSDYYSILGANNDMIKFMKDSLAIASKFWGQSYQTGDKMYELADRYLRGGRIKESIDMFTKAKENLERNKTITSKLGLTYMKLASIYLSELDYQKCIDHAKRSLQVFQDYQKKTKSLGLINEPYKIKTYQILARVYEICDQRTDYKDLALNCAKRFNLTKNKEVYEQMIKICLASVIFKSPVQRCKSFLTIAQDMEDQARENGGLNQRLSPMEQVMKLSEDFVVMEKFIYKFQFMERSLTELGNRKRINLNDENKEFLHILENIIEIVGIDYIEGLVEEKNNYGP